MKIISEAMQGGRIPDRFGKRGGQINEAGIPTCSIPVEISEAPAGTKCFALVLEDKDAAPVCGFTWIHWIAANITRTVLEENSSLTADDYIQGVNSWFKSCGREKAVGYGGMTPPDGPHRYELYVFALDRMLNLERGFFINQLYREMEGHILAQERLTGVYDS